MSNLKSVSSTSTARLKQDYVRLLKDPVPFVRAVPLPTNILTWHYVVQGPPNTPYDGGFYHGKLVFPREFPFKPPAIYMITPNGRFKVNQKLCLSISDYHPDTWNPAWSVSTILTGLLSFMVETTPTSGSIESNESTKRRLAIESREFNLQDKLFCELFPELSETLEKEAREQEEKQKAAEIQSSSLQNDQTSSKNLLVEDNKTATNNNNNNNSWFYSLLSNMFVMIGLALLAFIAKYLFKYN